VARVKEEAVGRLREALHDPLNGGQRLDLDQLLRSPKASGRPSWTAGAPAQQSGKNPEIATVGHNR
jgi:hypothetical protein